MLSTLARLSSGKPKSAFVQGTPILGGRVGRMPLQHLRPSALEASSILPRSEEGELVPLNGQDGQIMTAKQQQQLPPPSPFKDGKRLSAADDDAFWDNLLLAATKTKSQKTEKTGR